MDYRPHIPNDRPERAANCAHNNVGGPCWGQVEWYERRHPLKGRVAMPLCRGHLGATYEPAAIAAAAVEAL